jgi:3-deoxy-D-manno-octulosonic-acid transferase
MPKFSFLYDFAWSLFLIFSLPILFLSRDKWLYEKLAVKLPPVPTGRKNIWIHALSVGEVMSAIPLVDAIRKQYPSRTIVFTVKTEHGMKIALERLRGKVDILLPMPLDCWWSIRRLVNYVRPSVLLLVESDIWPGLLSFLKKRGVKAILINGRISPRTFRAYRRFRFLSRRMLDYLDMCLMQSEQDKVMLLRIGMKNNKLAAVGNIKFDMEWKPMDERERGYWSERLRLKTGSRILVAGSTHEGEEGVLLEAFKRLKGIFPDLILIIVPRNVTRSGDVYGLSVGMGLETVLLSDLEAGGKPPYQVLILDTVGELSRVYGLGDISFVGGSMVPVGGHNLLEPASFGCPVLFGEYTHNFHLMSQLLIKAGGGHRIYGAEELFVVARRLLSDPSVLNQMGARAKAFVEKNKGAVERVMEYLEDYIETA